ASEASPTQRVPTAQAGDLSTHDPYSVRISRWVSFLTNPTCELVRTLSAPINWPTTVMVTVSAELFCGATPNRNGKFTLSPATAAARGKVAWALPMVATT